MVEFVWMLFLEIIFTFARSWMSCPFGLLFSVCADLVYGTLSCCWSF